MSQPSKQQNQYCTHRPIARKRLPFFNKIFEFSLNWPHSIFAINDFVLSWLAVLLSRSHADRRNCLISISSALYVVFGPCYVHSPRMCVSLSHNKLTALWLTVFRPCILCSLLVGFGRNAHIQWVCVCVFHCLQPFANACAWMWLGFYVFILHYVFEKCSKNHWTKAPTNWNSIGFCLAWRALCVSWILIFCRLGAIHHLLISNVIFSCCLVPSSLMESTAMHTACKWLLDQSSRVNATDKPFQWDPPLFAGNLIRMLMSRPNNPKRFVCNTNTPITVNPLLCRCTVIEPLFELIDW